jgi:hypothetical protein
MVCPPLSGVSNKAAVSAITTALVGSATASVLFPGAFNDRKAVPAVAVALKLSSAAGIIFSVQSLQLCFWNVAPTSLSLSFAAGKVFSAQSLQLCSSNVAPHILNLSFAAVAMFSAQSLTPENNEPTSLMRFSAFSAPSLKPIRDAVVPASFEIAKFALASTLSPEASSTAFLAPAAAVAQAMNFGILPACSDKGIAPATVNPAIFGFRKEVEVSCGSVVMSCGSDAKEPKHDVDPAIASFLTDSAIATVDLPAEVDEAAAAAATHLASAKSAVTSVHLPVIANEAAVPAADVDLDWLCSISPTIVRSAAADSLVFGCASPST